MREEKEKILKNELRVLALKTRDNKRLTQKEMAELLSMSETSYSDIERGVYKCSALTVVLLLAEQEDPREFLQYVKDKFEQQYNKEMQPV